MRRCIAAIVLACAAAFALGCASTPPAAVEAPPPRATGPRVAASFELDAFPFARSGAVTGFAVCGDDVVLVAHGGGVEYAGFGRPFVPSSAQATSVGCDARGRVAMIAGDRLVVAPLAASADRAGVVATLPHGDLHLVRGPLGTTWVWGTRSTGGVLARVDRAGAKVLYAGSQPVRAATAVGGSIAAVVGDTLTVWSGDGPARALLELPSAVEGVAVDARGDVYVSDGRRIIGISDRGPRIVAEGLHGDLAARGDALYVLWRERSTVVRLRPHADSR